jgi:hypothetical protein
MNVLACIPRRNDVNYEEPGIKTVPKEIIEYKDNPKKMF